MGNRGTAVRGIGINFVTIRIPRNSDAVHFRCRAPGLVAKLNIAVSTTLIVLVCFMV